MARKKTATVEYLKGKVWSLSIKSSDRDLRTDLIDVIQSASRSGLVVLNAADPFAGFESKPRKARVKKRKELCDRCGQGQDGCSCEVLP